MTTAIFQMTNTHRVDVDEVLPGGYFKFNGHQMPDCLYDEWWKVSQRVGSAVRLVNRDGVTRTLLLGHWEGIRCFQWIPSEGGSA